MDLSYFTKIFLLLILSIIGCVPFVVRSLSSDWYKSRKRWSSAEIDVYRKLLDDELLDKNVRDGLAKRYNIDVFFLNTGIRSSSYEDVTRLVSLLNDDEKQFSEQTLRMIYPKYLKFENGIPRIRLTRSDQLEAGLRNFLIILSGLYLGLYMYNVTSQPWSGPLFVAAIPLIGFARLLLLLGEPHKRAKALSRKLKNNAAVP